MSSARGHEIRLLTGEEMEFGHWRRAYRIGGFCATKGCLETPIYAQSFMFERTEKLVHVRKRECCFRHAAMFAVVHGLRVPAAVKTRKPESFRTNGEGGAVVA